MLNHHLSAFKKTMSDCVLCHDARCTAGCQFGLEPDRILRSIRFDNGAGAYVRLKNNFHCAECSGSCEEACILPEKRFSTCPAGSVQAKSRPGP